MPDAKTMNELPLESTVSTIANSHLYGLFTTCIFNDILLSTDDPDLQGFHALALASRSSDNAIADLRLPVLVLHVGLIADPMANRCVHQSDCDRL
jgi:hypothetical protein